MAANLTPGDVNRFVAEVFPSSYSDGIRCAAIEPGSATACWSFDASKLRPGGYVPGPTIFAVADSALWYAAFSLVGLEPMAVTSELSIRFLRPARGGDLVGRAVVNSHSARRVVGTVELWVDGAPEKLVAVAQGSYARPDGSVDGSNAMNPPAAQDGAGAS